MAIPAKKLVIKSFKNKNFLTEEDVKATLKLLMNAIEEIYQHNASKLSFEELYRSAYNLTINKREELLYNEIHNSIQRHLQLSTDGIVKSSNDRLLSVVSSAWQEHITIMQMIKDIMMYLDRSYLSNNKKVSVFNMSILVFRSVILYHADVRERVRTLLLESVLKERNGLLVDGDVIKKILCMLGDCCVDGINVYEQEFEHYFLEETRAFYRQESQQLLQIGNCSEYLKKVEARLREEANRSRSYLPAATEPKLKHMVELECITTHATAIVNMEGSGCVAMIRENRLDDLTRLYSLFLRVPSTLELVRDSMASYAKELGLAIVADQQNAKEPVNFVNNVLQLKAKFDLIIDNCFRGDKKAHKRLKEAFEDFVNRDSRCASHLATYMDDLLKAGLKGVGESELESRLEQITVLFRYLSDKDVFECFYRSHLSKRLLQGKSVSDETEKLMISKLKSECGQQFTSKIEGMFLDMKLSKEIMDGFLEFCHHSAAPQPGGAAALNASTSSVATSASGSGSGSASSAHSVMEMEVQTLTSSHWSLKPSPECILPKELRDGCDKFTAYYLHRFKAGRRLTWLTTAGSVDVKANFSGGKRELNVSVYQVCILMQFNNQQSWTLDALREACGIKSELEFRRHLLSLCTPKLKILSKASKGKFIEDEDVITYNDEFTSKYKRIKVPLIAASSTLPGNNTGNMGNTGDHDNDMMAMMDGVGGGGGVGTGVGGSTAADYLTDGKGIGEDGVPVSVVEDRRHLVEAAVVRIMKARKRLSHNDLVTEVTRQLSMRFNPAPPFIKKRVESLIEREYLQRDAEDRRIYQYVA